MRLNETPRPGVHSYFMKQSLAGNYHRLEVLRLTSIGAYLDGKDAGDILLPKRFLPEDIREGQQLKVFVYHDSEDRLIATTQRPHALVGEIASLLCVGTMPQGAFLDWGLMKDVFVPVSQQTDRIQKGQYYLVKLYQDEQTGRVAATQKFGYQITNDNLELQVHDVVDLLVWQKSDIGYKVIINNQNHGVLHYDDVFKPLEIGDKLQGFIKKIYEDNRIDVMPGERGYARVNDESDVILDKLRAEGSYLPYHDKSDPEEIKAAFGISKKTFKMAVGKLYKEGKIELTKTGIKLVE